ncbi:MAG: hypothetical protein NTV77_02785 [Candidatus Azambacteria bacterium]|nr:hypothetical protein [Candidatus Azambacteria bacterium]
MILASHIIVSGLLGATTQNYFLAAVFGFTSHYILDAIPHWDYLSDEFELRTKTEKDFIKNKKFWRELINVALDILIGLGLLFIFLKYYKNPQIIPAIIGISFGVLPDPLGLLYWITKWKFIKWNFDLQEFAHYLIDLKTGQKFWLGTIIQTATIGIVFLILYKF